MTTDKIQNHKKLARNCISRARCNLTQARYYKQKAEAVDFLSRCPGSILHPQDAVRWLDLASKCRAMAKADLLEYEKHQGTLYTLGAHVWPLKIKLAGRLFQNWPEYKLLFSNRVVGDIWR